MRTPFVTALAVLILIDALGWALGVLATLRYVITHRSLPTVGGIRLLSGPFETLGIEGNVPPGSTILYTDEAAN